MSLFLVSVPCISCVSLCLLHTVQPNIVIKAVLPFLCSPSETTPLLSVDIAGVKQNPGLTAGRLNSPGLRGATASAPIVQIRLQYLDVG